MDRSVSLEEEEGRSDEQANSQSRRPVQNRDWIPDQTSALRADDRIRQEPLSHVAREMLDDHGSEPERGRHRVLVDVHAWREFDRREVEGRRWLLWVSRDR